MGLYLGRQIGTAEGAVAVVVIASAVLGAIINSWKGLFIPAGLLVLLIASELIAGPDSTSDTTPVEAIAIVGAYLLFSLGAMAIGLGTRRAFEAISKWRRAQKPQT